ARGQGRRESMTLSYDTDGTTLGGGTGTLSFDEPGGTSYAGAWVLSWAAQPPDIPIAGSFCLAVVEEDCINTIVQVFNGQVPDGSIIIAEGSVVGDTLSYTIELTGDSPYTYMFNFPPTPFGSGGTFSGSVSLLGNTTPANGTFTMQQGSGC